MTREPDDQTPDDSDAVEHAGPVRVESPTEARALEHAESVPTPPPTPSGQPPMDSDEIELEISSPKLRLLKKRRYIALPDVRPPRSEEEEISRIIKRLEMDLEVAFGKIKGKSHRKPSRESNLIIEMRMSGDLDRGSTKVKLKPCIWFFCGSRWCRKIIEKDIKKLNWRLPCDLQIVDEGGPFAFLATSGDPGEYGREDSGSDDCGESDLDDDEELGLEEYQSETSCHAAGLPDLGIITLDEYQSNHGSLEELLPSDHTDSGSYCPSIATAHSAAASDQPSSSNSSTDVYNTIDRQSPRKNLNLLPCEFSMIGCGIVFHGDEEDEWIEHIMSHMRNVLPRKLRCWYCVKCTFDTDSTTKEDLKTNFKNRMQHIRHHILLDTVPVSWARPDMSVIKHMLLHKFIDEETFHRLVTQNTVFSGPGYLPMHNIARRSLPERSSLKLSDDMFLDFHVQESNADSSIGLTCRSTIRKHRTVISESLSRMGGVITVTRGSENTLYGVTSGHGMLCQILENTSSVSSGSDEPDALSDASSQSSVSDQDLASDIEPKEQGNQRPPLTASHEKVERWMNASHGLVATFLNWRADSVGSFMATRETPSMSGNNSSGDLALIKIPTEHARGLRNDFVDPAGSVDAAREAERFSAVTETSNRRNKVSVLLGKTKSISGHLVAGTIHFSVGGRTIDCTRIMLSEELGLGSSGSWVVEENNILYGMVIAITPLDGCALILPQRQMYSDVQQLFPDATSILLSSGVPDVVPRIKSRSPPVEQVEPQVKIESEIWAVEQVNFEPQMRTGRGIWERRGKGKEKEKPPSYFDPWQQDSGLDRQEKRTLAVEITTNASGNRRRRPQGRYYS